MRLRLKTSVIYEGIGNKSNLFENSSLIKTQILKLEIYIHIPICFTAKVRFVNLNELPNVKIMNYNPVGSIKIDDGSMLSIWAI